MFGALGLAQSAFQTMFLAYCRICTVDGALPIGAPTSPVLSNIVSRRLDQAASRYRSGSHRYTRYADDLTFSARKPHFPTEFTEYRVDGTVAIGPALGQTIWKTVSESRNPECQARIHSESNRHYRQREAKRGQEVGPESPGDDAQLRTRGADACRERYIETKQGSRNRDRSVPDFLLVLRGKSLTWATFVARGRPLPQVPGPDLRDSKRLERSLRQEPG